VINFQHAKSEAPRGHGDGGADPGSGAKAIFDDARLMQAVVVLDRFDVGPFALENDLLTPGATDFLYHMVSDFGSRELDVRVINVGALIDLVINSAIFGCICGNWLGCGRRNAFRAWWCCW
jgi:hypothetical protein